MRMAYARRLLASALALAAAPLALHGAAHAQDVTAAVAHDVSVTVYRDPYRQAGGFNLNYLNGFAFITETRRVVLEPGLHRLRFEGVSDGIDPATAIVTGLPSGVIEKNRDAALLSPLALVNAAQEQGGRVQLVRTDPATGKTTRTQGVIRSAADGVVFETPGGVEALQCSGLPETFDFDSTGSGLSAKPTLSVLTRTDQRIEATVQLSYLARGFDWSADYVATMTPTPGKFDLGGWITLANGNGTGFPNARVQVVAGRLNRETGNVDPIALGQPILADCWPQGTTSDIEPPIEIERAYPLGFDPDSFFDDSDRVMVTAARVPMPAPPPAPMAVAGASAAETATVEDLGDLKLYRIPDRATVSSRQSKQVRLLDRAAVPMKRIYEVSINPNYTMPFVPMTILLRTNNDTKNNLGLPLPSGRVAVFETAGNGAAARRLLSAETSLRDLAIDEETELRLAQSPDVQISQTVLSRTVTGPPLPTVPGAERLSPTTQVSRIELTNARPFAIQAEVRLNLYGAQQVARADRPVEQKNGRPIFRVTVPANSSLQINYQIARQ
jgi:hypothetical protein